MITNKRNKLETAKKLKVTFSILALSFLFLGNVQAAESFSEKETILQLEQNNPPDNDPDAAEKELNSFALAGVVSLLLTPMIFPVVFGIIARRQIATDPKRYTKLSKTLANLAFYAGIAINTFYLLLVALYFYIFSYLFI